MDYWSYLVRSVGLNMDEAQLRAQRIIKLLQAKADRTDSDEEKTAITAKIAELKERYKLPQYPLPWNHNTTDPWVTVNNVQWTNRGDFVKTFFGDRPPDHVTLFPTAAGKSYLFSTWLSDMDSNPEANEEGWQLIDNWENE